MPALTKEQADAWSKRNKQAVGGLLDVNQFIPVSGDIQSGIMAGQDLSQGNYGSAALNAVGLLPFVPSLAGTIKNVTKIDELTGLPLNSDGTVTLFHHTNKNAAEQIAKTKRLQSAGEPDVYLTTYKETDTGYGDTAVPIRIKPSLLNLDDEFPNGRLDFRVNVGKQKGSIPIVIEKNK
jgi:hypothetical protein